MKKYVDSKSNLQVKFYLAIRNRGYTDETRLRGLFNEVHVG
ncbi:MAG: hypothetical protein RMY62_007755 [Nostoc sp. ZfuVER08]